MSGTQSLQRVLFVSGSGGSNTLRYRVRLAEEALRSRGVATAAVHFTEPVLSSWAREADVIALYRVPATKSVVSLVGYARRRGVPVTFDVDDRVFLAEHTADIPFLDQLRAHERAVFESDMPARATTARLADFGSGSTGAIVADLATLVPGPVTVLPNGVGQVASRCADRVLAQRVEPRDTVRLGYFSGSATHDADWAAIEPDVLELMRSDPRIELWLVGRVSPSTALEGFGERVQRKPAVQWQDLFGLLAEVDVNLAPLDASPFTVAKSAIKWMEAALVQLPTVATSTPPFQEVITSGVDGMLVPVGQPWGPTVAALVDDAGLRRAMGRAARQRALTDLGPDTQAERYLRYFRSTLTEPRSDARDLTLTQARAAARRVVTLGVSLEPYPFPQTPAAAELDEPVWATALSRGRTAARRAYGTVRARSKAAGRRVVREGRRIDKGIRRRVARRRGSPAG
jgi:glycosyltransferase involved in cell wall biosynthesis